MKTNAKTLMVLLVFLLTSGFRNEMGNDISINDPSSNDANTKFTLVRSDDDISLYTRWIHVNETTLTRQVKAEFVVDCPAEKVVSILRDEKTYLQWMKATKAFYRIKTIDENRWYSYVQFSIPWPLDNQDCILKYEVHENPESSCTEIILEGDADFLEPNKGIERIRHIAGCGIILQIDGGKTRVEYYVYSKQKPTFPTWLTDPLVQKNLIKSLDALRDLAKRNTEQSAQR
jgi:hypothetical protein